MVAMNLREEVVWHVAMVGNVFGNRFRKTEIGKDKSKSAAIRKLWLLRECR